MIYHREYQKPQFPQRRQRLGGMLNYFIVWQPEG